MCRCTCMWMYWYMYMYLGGETESSYKHYVSGQVSALKGMLHLCYHRRIAEGFLVGTEVTVDHMRGEAVGAVGYQYEIPKANVSFKSTLIHFFL